MPEEPKSKPAQISGKAIVLPVRDIRKGSVKETIPRHRWTDDVAAGDIDGIMNNDDFVMEDDNFLIDT